MASKAEQVAKALKRAADEHGVPNGISPGELAQDFSRCLTPFHIGFVLTFERFALNSLLAQYRLKVTSYDDAGEGYGKRIGYESL